ncbi:MAG: RnfABCDGE type electron transport complex subunit D [Ardenticatenales bacterium]
MVRSVDRLLNRITMYRLALYYLIALLAIALVLSFTGALPYDPFGLLLSIGVLVGACALTSWIFSRAFGVPANVESSYITALILALIITPPTSTSDLWFLLWAAVWAMASKYMLAIHRKHVFNPATFAVALTYLTIDQSASWWVGEGRMLPFVLIGGVLIVRKIRRLDLVATFLVAALATVVAFSLLGGENPAVALQRTLLSSPLLFFAVVILTEPMTTPPRRSMRLVYGGLVGVLFTPQIHFGTLFATPELAMVVGNVFGYLVSPKATLLLNLRKKVHLAPNIYDFVFVPPRKLAYEPGQYMEWTLGHDAPDSRGNRRFFTLASSPTEDTLRLGVAFNPTSSTFKQALLSLEPRHGIVAAQLAGDFVLPSDPDQPCVFIAGGIGITPFRSMIKYLLDTGQRRPIVLFYANKTADDIVYRDVFDRAAREVGIRTIYALTDTARIPPDWDGWSGRITGELIAQAVPDYRRCTFYLAGPPAMVDGFRDVLSRMDVKRGQIKTDAFAGLG